MSSRSPTPAAAEDGLSTLVDDCGGGEGAEGDVGGWVVEGDWVVVAETEEIAQKVVDAADGATLAGDAAFQEWTERGRRRRLHVACTSPGVHRSTSTSSAGMGSAMADGAACSGAGE